MARTEFGAERLQRSEPARGPPGFRTSGLTGRSNGETTGAGRRRAKNGPGYGFVISNLQYVVEELGAHIDRISTTEQHDPGNLTKQFFGEDEGPDPRLSIQKVERLLECEACHNPSVSGDQGSGREPDGDPADREILLGQRSERTLGPLQPYGSILEGEGQHSAAGHPRYKPGSSIE